LPLSNTVQDSALTFVDYSTIEFTQSQSTTASLSQPNAPKEEPIVLTDEERPFTIQLSQSTINTTELPTSIPTFMQPLPSPLTEKIKKFADCIANVPEEKLIEEIMNTSKWSCGERGDTNNKKKLLKIAKKARRTQ
jgi:hypothetical protein